MPASRRKLLYDKKPHRYLSGNPRSQPAAAPLAGCRKHVCYESTTMQSLPHHYKVTASAEPMGGVSIASPGLPTLDTAPPAEYGGPGDQWSPESLLVAAVADCFTLSFRACARASQLEWLSLGCDVTGELDRSEGVTRFVGMTVRAVLRGAADTDPEQARRVLEKAEKTCLITNSLICETRLETEFEASA